MTEHPLQSRPRPGRIGTLIRLYRPKALSRKHPHVTDRARTFLATLTFSELVVSFIAILVFATLSAGVAFKLLAPSGLYPGYPEALVSAFFTLIGMPPGSLDPDVLTGAFKVVVGIVGLGSLLLPALFLGAIVFRLFVRLRVFVLKERPTLSRRKVRGIEGWYLVIRLYSSTSIQVVDIDFKVYLQMDCSDGTLANEKLMVANANWPIAETHVPYTLCLPVEPGDLGPGNRLVSLQGHDLENSKQMIIHIRGISPQLASEVNETHEVGIPLDLSPARFGGVDVLYDGRGPDWNGWENFEKDDPLK